MNSVNLKNNKTVQIIINDNQISDNGLMLEFTHEIAQLLAMKTKRPVM